MTMLQCQAQTIFIAFFSAILFSNCQASHYKLNFTTIDESPINSTEPILNHSRNNWTESFFDYNPERQEVKSMCKNFCQKWSATQKFLIDAFGSANFKNKSGEDYNMQTL